MPDLSSIPAPVLSWGGAIIVAIIGVYFSRKKTGAEVADKITLAAGRNMDRLEKQLAGSDERIKRLEEKAIRQEKKMNGMQLESSQLKRENRTLRDRVSSLEENDRTTRLAMEILEGEYKTLQIIMKDWHAGILVLIAQIERHDSSPEWRPKDD